MEFNLLFICSIIILMLLYLISSKNENFKGIKPRLHAKIGKNGKVIYYSWQSPRQNGEHGCALVPCPQYLDDNITCWCCCNYS